MKLIYFLFFLSIFPTHGKHKTLFIGNSLLKRNCFPCMYAKLAPKHINIATCLKGSSPLIYHIYNKRCKRKLRKRYKTVLLQEQSQMLLNQNYNENALKSIILQHNDTRILSTWPHENNYYKDERTLRYRYKHLGKKYNVTVVPISLYWTYTKIFYPHIQLTTDGIHPTREGTFLAACVTAKNVYKTVTQFKPKKIKKNTYKLLYKICNSN